MRRSTPLPSGSYCCATMQDTHSQGYRVLHGPGLAESCTTHKNWRGSLTWLLLAAAQLEEAKFFYANYHKGRARGGGGAPRAPAGASGTPSPRSHHGVPAPPVTHTALAPAPSRAMRCLDLAGVADAPSPPVGAQLCARQHTGAGGARGAGQPPASPASRRECQQADALDGALVPAAGCSGDDAAPCKAEAADARLHSAADGPGCEAGAPGWASPIAGSPFLSSNHPGRAAADAAADFPGRVQAQPAGAADAAPEWSGSGSTEPFQGLRRAASLPLLAPALARVAARFEARRAGYLAERACWEAMAGDSAGEALAGAEGGTRRRARGGAEHACWEGAASDSGGGAPAGAGVRARRRPRDGAATAGCAAESGRPLGEHAVYAGLGASQVPTMRAALPAVAASPCASGPAAGAGLGAGLWGPVPMDSVARHAARGRRGKQRSTGPGKAGGLLEADGVRPARDGKTGAGPGQRHADGRMPAQALAGTPACDLMGLAWAVPPAPPLVRLEGAGVAAPPSPLGRAYREAGARPATPLRSTAAGLGLATGAPVGRHPAARARRRAQRRLHGAGAGADAHDRAGGAPAGAPEPEACASPGAHPQARPGPLRDCASAVWLSAASPAPAAAASRRAEWPDPLAWTAEAARFRFRTLALSFDDARVPGALRPLVQARAQEANEG